MGCGVSDARRGEGLQHTERSHVVNTSSDRLRKNSQNRTIGPIDSGIRQSSTIKTRRQCSSPAGGSNARNTTYLITFIFFRTHSRQVICHQSLSSGGFAGAIREQAAHVQAGNAPTTLSRRPSARAPAHRRRMIPTQRRCENQNPTEPA